ncbi:MAG: DNA mismatch repair endonuclease MutL [Verrucomicrobiae bacterium]|nr:DNA mismatch repair endonuclease MutL [Verrucomicrobiae bacterium]
MNRIRLLSEQVANQIAAGEVVERPASVVKELVENSLDAGATRIAVEIAAAGRGLIRVTDDGSGMSRDDALLCLERHATSKITAADDLIRVTTMGFRGEAIPSIASVSRFSLTTRERDVGDGTAPGTQIVIHGGKILEVRESGGAPGTVIEVRGLFFNMPARRKFLRSDETERAHIQHWLTTAALAHPHVAFSLSVEGRTVWHLPAEAARETPADVHRSLRERLRLLVGDGLEWVAVDAEGELGAARVAPERPEAPPETSPPSPVRIWGWIGAPGVSRATRDDQHLFVNRRPVENRGLNASLLEGYHNALMKGRYPMACLFLELDPAEVDVNIHPAKREVKFHREWAVRRFVAGAVREALKDWHLSATGGNSTPSAVPPNPISAHGPAAVGSESGTRLPPAPVQPEWHQVTGTQPARPSTAAPLAAPTPNPPAGSAPRGDAASTSAVSGPIDGVKADPGSRMEPDSPATIPSAGSSAGPAGVPSASARAATTAPALVQPLPLLAIPLRVVGVVGRLYVVLESDRGLVLMDQHAAHERVLYEQMLRRMEKGDGAPSQRLLLPETLELSPRDAAFLRENLTALGRLGVGLSEFGERTFLLDALPAFVKSAAPRQFALELVDELRAAGSSVNAWRLGEAVVAKTVCRHSVKANDPLAVPEIEALLDDLRRCDMPYTCPHGRPTLIEMSLRELDRRFGRV